MPRKIKIALLSCGILTVVTLPLWGPLVVFDNSQPAYDVNSEYEYGKPTAWGPRPAKWIIFADPGRSTFDGGEWPFVIFRPYCRRWVLEHDYTFPTWPQHKM